MAGQTSVTVVTTTAGTTPDVPNVDFVRPEVSERSEQYEIIRDCLAGQETIKKKTTKYLPMPNAANQTPENQERYKGYVTRALYYNVTGNTIAGLVGQVFASDPVSEFPEQLNPLWDDVTGGGVTMPQQAKLCLSHVLAFGRCGLLVDFPKRKEDGTDFTREEVNSGVARPTIQFYDSEAIPNWRYRMIGAKSVLSMVVLNEQYIVSDDGFEIKTGKSKRVLRLDDENLYVVDEWRAINGDPAQGWMQMPPVMPTDGNGARLDFIPFTFIGSQNNDSNVDRPPMYDMACINIAHYRNSADYEDAVYMLGQPTPYFAGLTEHWVKEVLKGEIQLGARAAVPLPEGGTAGLIQVSENTMVKEAMDKKEQQMIAIGAQLVEDKEVQRTLGEAKMQSAVVSSTLSSCANNVSRAVETCIKWACLFYGIEPEDMVEGEEEPSANVVSFILSTDFAIQKLSPQERAQLLAEWQGGGITWGEYRGQLRQSGVATEDDEVAKESIAGDQQAQIDMDKANGLGPDGKPLQTDDNNDPNKTGNE